MSITPDGWFDWMPRDLGPPEKQYFDRTTGAPIRNTATVYIPHSAVGDSYWAWRDGRLWNMARDTQGNFTPAGRASIHGWINKDGSVIQHYPIWTSCWSSGSFRINANAVAFENQGGADTPATVSEPLTEAQLAVNVRIIKELSEHVGWIPQRPLTTFDLRASLYEHRECTRFHAAATACPSNRIPWDEIMRRLAPPTGEDDLSAEELDELEELRARALLIGTLDKYRVVRLADHPDFGWPIVTLRNRDGTECDPPIPPIAIR